MQGTDGQFRFVTTEVLPDIPVLSWQFVPDINRIEVEDLRRRRNRPIPIPKGKRKPPGRNEQCPCGSGLKYKRCCGCA